MKILFTADWHIKLGQKNVPRDWQRNRFRMLFQELEYHAQLNEVDLIINGGDIFDRMPTLEELELYFEYIASIKTTTIIYDGNHEATKKGETFFTKLKEVTKKINDKVQICDDIDTIPGINFLPYTRLKNFKIGDFNSLERILCTHVRGEIPPHVKPEIDLDVFKTWDLVLAGDLHSHTNSQGNILYPGSPLTTSFHRKEVSTGILIVDTDTLDYEFVELELPQLIRKTVSSAKEMIKTDFNHTIYEVEGDMLELADLDMDHDLVDKKVIKKETEARLRLANLSIREELNKYLTEVLRIEDTDKIMGVFNDYYSGALVE